MEIQQSKTNEYFVIIVNSNSVCLQQWQSGSSGAGCGRYLRQSASPFLLTSAGQAGLAAIPANQRLPSSEHGEVSSRLPVWSVATMDAIPCFLLVLLFGTRIQENTGKFLFNGQLGVVLCVSYVFPESYTHGSGRFRQKSSLFKTPEEAECV